MATVLLLKLHHGQLSATPACRGLLVDLQRRLRGRIQGLKNVMGFNLAAVRHLQRRAREQHAAEPSDAILPAKRKLAAALA